VTLFDVYECAINPDKLECTIKEGEAFFKQRNPCWCAMPNSSCGGSIATTLKRRVEPTDSTNKPKIRLAVDTDAFPHWRVSTSRPAL
jgi:hypothetical protein